MPLMLNYQILISQFVRLVSEDGAVAHQYEHIGVSLVGENMVRVGTLGNLQIDNLQRGLTSLLQPIPATRFLIVIL